MHCFLIRYYFRSRGNLQDEKKCCSGDPEGSENCRHPQSRPLRLKERVQPEVVHEVPLLNVERDDRLEKWRCLHIQKTQVMKGGEGQHKWRQAKKRRRGQPAGQDWCRAGRLAGARPRTPQVQGPGWAEQGEPAGRAGPSPLQGTRGLSEIGCLRV